MTSNPNSPTVGKEPSGSTVSEREALLASIDDTSSGRPVNPVRWRFRCPNGHHHLRWASRQTVECRTCAGGYKSFATADIEDAKTGGTLEEAFGQVEA